MHDRFARACALFEQAHREDPEVVEHQGERVPAAVLYHRRVAAWIDRLEPAASEPLRLAARCQHIRRWRVPRDTFPSGPTGYKQWRARLAQLHAEQSAEILTQVGYDAGAIECVRGLLIKKGLRSAADGADVQILEDAVCLTFLEQRLDAFAAEHEEEKAVDVLRKTWAKMGERGRAAAQELLPGLSPRARGLIERALAAPEGR